MAPDPIRQRRERIKALVAEQGFCTIGELAETLRVSEMTIRRDIALLEEAESQLRSVHGGVSAMPAQQLAGTEFKLRSRNRPSLKEAIARGALEFLPTTGGIAIDAGTSALEFARLLPDDSALKVVTHSVPVLNLLMGRQSLDVIGLGGSLQHSSQSLVGANTVSMIRDLQVNTFFMGASSVNARGAFCANDFDAVIKRALMAVAKTVVLLADSSKFSAEATVRICALDALSAIVVDDGISVEWRRRLRAAGARVVVVPTVTSPRRRVSV
jgi:DeoR/GlpR family transcriptional regulator of sugar metabolism